MVKKVNPTASAKTRHWFQGKARTAAGYRKNLVSNTDRLRNNFVIGKMFFFFYDPKYKDTLPIYDRFPMVFPIERYDNGFLGLNLHYLSVPERRLLLSELMSFATNQRLTPRTRLKLQYSLLQNTKRLSTLSRPCIKRYLTTHMRSRFVEIMPDEWAHVLALPVADFVKKP